MSRRGDSFAPEAWFLVVLFLLSIAGGFLGVMFGFWLSPCAC